MSGLLAWALETAPPPPKLLDVKESEPLVPYPPSLIGTWVTMPPGGGRVVYRLTADGAVRMEMWDR